MYIHYTSPENPVKRHPTAEEFFCFLSVWRPSRQYRHVMIIYIRTGIWQGIGQSGICFGGRTGMIAKEDYEILAGDLICAKYEDGELEVVNEQFAPLFLSDFRAWVESRSISGQRGFTSRNVKRASGLSANASDYETALEANCACMTDNYWVRKSGSDLTYADVNYDKYDGELAQLALGLTSISYAVYMRHPELTNIGDSDKAWVVDRSGIRWLHKKQPFRECFCEILASKIAKRLGIDTVEYELVTMTEDPEEGRWGIVRSEDFTQGKAINLEHAESILTHFGTDEKDIEENKKIFHSYGCVKEYLSIKYLDILTGNPDRHMRNYGILRDQKDGRVIGLAPNYDNNYAFRDDLQISGFLQAASEYGYVPPVLTEKDIEELKEEMRSVSSLYDAGKLLQSLEWKQKYVSGHVSVR